jgi:8-oxo-dGTP diphosphatase
MTIGRFLAGIGVLVWDEEAEHCLLLRRSAEKDFAAGAWECVTGRLEQGEGFEDAARREVLEELGFQVELIALLGTTHFYRGAPEPGNELVGVVYCATAGPDHGFRLSDEHSEARWLRPAEARALLNAQEPSERWLIEVIGRAERLLTLMPAPLLAAHRQASSELEF